MNSTYSLTEGNDALNRVLLMMRYQLGKTLNENVEVISEQPESRGLPPEQIQYQYLQKQKEKRKEEQIKGVEEDWLKKYIQLTTPLNTSNNSDTVIIPRDSKYTMWEDSNNRQKSMFKTWLDSSRMSEVPDEMLLKKIK